MAQTATVTTAIPAETAKTTKLRLLAVAPDADAAVHDEPKTAPFFEPPQYTMKDIHDAIPKHCFERNSLLSFGYMLRDFAMVFSLMYLAATFIPGIENDYLRKALWTAYSFLQGCFFTGLWELAHECGHGALSPKKWVNNSMGMLMHSFLLVPFHSWRFTHSTHHKTTNNIEKDIAFVPDVKADWVAKRRGRDWFMKTLEVIEDMPIAVMLELLGHQLIAWPIYLTINNFALPRMAAISWWKRSHFYAGGDGPNFKPANTKDIIISDLGIAAALAVIYACVQVFGKWNVMLLYGFPYLWTNHWICESSLPWSVTCHHKHETAQPLTSYSDHHFPPAHGLLHSLLPNQDVDVSQGSCVDSGPRFWLHRQSAVPRGHRDARPASPCIAHSVLPRHRGYAGDPRRNGGSLPE